MSWGQGRVSCTASAVCTPVRALTVRWSPSGPRCFCRHPPSLLGRWTFEAMILMSGWLAQPDIMVAVMGLLVNTSGAGLLPPPAQAPSDGRPPSPAGGSLLYRPSLPPSHPAGPPHPAAGIIWMWVSGYALACSTRVSNSLVRVCVCVCVCYGAEGWGRRACVWPAEPSDRWKKFLSSRPMSFEWLCCCSVPGRGLPPHRAARHLDGRGHRGGPGAGRHGRHAGAAQPLGAAVRRCGRWAGQQGSRAGGMPGPRVRPAQQLARPVLLHRLPRPDAAALAPW